MTNLLHQAKRIEELESKINALEQSLSLITTILHTKGSDIGWMTPAVAGKHLGVSRAIIMREINKAELLRLQPTKGRSPLLAYGQDYRDVRSPGAMRPSWQVNVQGKIKSILAMTPESR